MDSTHSSRPSRGLAASLACLSCAAVATAQSSIFTLPGAGPGDAYGNAMAVVGDVDGDGVEDFATNAWIGLDRVEVRSGATQALLYTLSNNADDGFGLALAAIDDLDGDALPDLVVAADNSVKVFSSASGVQLHTFAIAGVRHVGGGGDATGDGVGDVLLGRNQELRVYDGASGALVRSHPAPAGACANFGTSPTFFGDANGDGVDDYAAGAPGALFCGVKTFVFAFDGASGAPLWSNEGWYNDELGWALAAFDDVNLDGAPELLVSAKQDPGIGCGGCSGQGYVRLLDGKTGVPLWQVNGTNPYSGLGFDLAHVADVDGDGVSDFAASQPGSLFGCDTSAAPVQVRSGATGALLFQIPWGGVGFGYSLAGGDVNGDGFGDLLVGAPCEPSIALSTGFVEAFTAQEPVATYCTAKQNSQGCLPAMSWTGVPSLALSTFRANANQVINQKNGILFWGRAPAAIPFLGGTLCVGGALTRTGVQSSAGNPPPDDCSGSYSYQFTSAYMATEAILAGESIHCQYWYRDPFSMPGSGLSDGLEFTVLP